MEATSQVRVWLRVREQVQVRGCTHLTCDDSSSASASARSAALLRCGARCRLGGGASSSAGAGALPYAPKFSSSASAAAAEPDMLAPHVAGAAERNTAHVTYNQRA